SSLRRLRGAGWARGRAAGSRDPCPSAIRRPCPRRAGCTLNLRASPCEKTGEELARGGPWGVRASLLAATYSADFSAAAALAASAFAFAASAFALAASILSAAAALMASPFSARSVFAASALRVEATALLRPSRYCGYEASLPKTRHSSPLGPKSRLFIQPRRTRRPELTEAEGFKLCSFNRAQSSGPRSSHTRASRSSQTAQPIENMPATNRMEVIFFDFMETTH